MLTNDQKKKLRSLAHQEKTLVYIGKQGLTENVLESFENALLAHNLVKVSLQKTAPVEVKEVATYLSDTFSCDVVSAVGRVIVLYRYNKGGRISV